MREGLIQGKGGGDANRERFRLEKAIYSYCAKYLKLCTQKTNPASA